MCVHMYECPFQRPRHHEQQASFFCKIHVDTHVRVKKCHVVGLRVRDKSQFFSFFDLRQPQVDSQEFL